MAVDVILLCYPNGLELAEATISQEVRTSAKLWEADTFALLREPITKNIHSNHNE